jgi:uncharacterized protein YcfL
MRKLFFILSVILLASCSSDSVSTTTPEAQVVYTIAALKTAAPEQK